MNASFPILYPSTISKGITSTLPDLYRSPLIEEEKHFIFAKGKRSKLAVLTGEMLVALHFEDLVDTCEGPGLLFRVETAGQRVVRRFSG
jgi:hypothetical protein